MGGKWKVFERLGRALMSSLQPSWKETQNFSRSEVQEQCRRICLKSRRHHQLAEHYCNRALTESEEQEQERLEQEIKALCATLPYVKGKPIYPSFQGDPRGATVKLVMPDGRYDDWGAVGICVPIREEDI